MGLSAQQIDEQVLAPFGGMKHQDTVHDWFTREIRKWATEQQRSSRENVVRIERDNALIVFDRLFKLLEKHGVEISVSTGDYGANGTFAVQNRKDEVRVYVCDKVQLYVTEEYKKIPHVPTAKELRDQQQPFPSRIPKFDSVPTGKLTLVPGGVVDLSSDDAIDALVTKATDDIMQQLEDERIRREAADAQRRLESRRQKEEQEEKTRVEAFHKAADALRHYREIMDYIDEVRRCGRVPNSRSSPSS